MGGRRRQEAAHLSGPSPPEHPLPSARRRDTGRRGPARPTSEGGPAAPGSRPRHIKARVGSPAAGHLVGWAVLRGPAVGQAWALVLLEGVQGGTRLGERSPQAPAGRFLAVPQTRQAPPTPRSLCACASLCPPPTPRPAPTPFVWVLTPLRTAQVSAQSHSRTLRDH